MCYFHPLLEKFCFKCTCNGQLNISNFGQPKNLIIDEDKCKVVHYALATLKIDIKLISPFNHGNLMREHYIQTTERVLYETFKTREKDGACCSILLAMNTNASTTIGFNPYILSFLD